MSINKAVVTGRLTKDSILKSGSGNSRWLLFSLASNERYKSGDEWVERANYIDCVIFGARAEALEKHLKKGVLVAVEGKLRYSSWESDGQKRSKLDVAVDDIELLGKPNRESSASDSQDGPIYG